MLNRKQNYSEKMSVTDYTKKTQGNTVYPRDIFCRYSFYTCGRKRAVKRNGTLHTLCDKHRADANRNQRRLAHRRKQEHVRPYEMHKKAQPKSIEPMTKLPISKTPVSKVSKLPANSALLNEAFCNAIYDNAESLLSCLEDMPTDFDLISGSFEPSLEMLQLEDEDIEWLEQTLWDDSPKKSALYM
jgi:hypothetical protein